MTEHAVAYHSGDGRFRHWTKDILNIFGYGTFYAFLSSMLWMEMIRLRTTPAQLKKVTGLLLDNLSRGVGEAGLVRMHMYNSASHQSDLALGLWWDTEFMLHEGSKAGLTMTEALKAFGLVEYSVWVEKETAWSIPAGQY
jgi:hypothetical protein